ncbi:YopX family protein [Bacillus atrophaeus]|uniref:YopX family protein n=1 Tax=Bacillus atrophaeus TaxID=1452 RepID=UPI00227E0CA7|nr:YopX family protein [Bacillus atrophaeus]MCY9166762.1 YopX family protein [Bacillus atrophaeus]
MNTAYRVWDGQQMHYWDDEGISLTIEGENWYLYRKDTGFITSNKTAHTALMWGTGLKDNNNREIYEGDIVCSEEYDRNFAVEYARDWSCFAYNRAASITDRILSLDRAGLYSEVIGDVYQNPELLEGAE